MALSSTGKQYLESRRNSLITDKTQSSKVHNRNRLSTDNVSYRGYPNGSHKISALTADRNIMNMIKEW